MIPILERYLGETYSRRRARALAHHHSIISKWHTHTPASTHARKKTLRIWFGSCLPPPPWPTPLTRTFATFYRSVYLCRIRLAECQTRASDASERKIKCDLFQVVVEWNYFARCESWNGYGYVYRERIKIKMQKIRLLEQMATSCANCVKLNLCHFSFEIHNQRRFATKWEILFPFDLCAWVCHVTTHDANGMRNHCVRRYSETHPKDVDTEKMEYVCAERRQ